MSRLYLSIRKKFCISFITSAIFAFICCLIAKNWYIDLSLVVGRVLALMIIGGIAIIPGFINMFLVVSTLLDSQKKYLEENPNDHVSVIIAAYNEGKTIYNTIKYVAKQSYDGQVTVLVADNNSSDNTYDEIIRAKNDFNIDIVYIFEKQQGKHYALNTALKYVKTKYVITLDADTLLHEKAIKYLVSRIHNDRVVAVAGAIMVKNNRGSIIAKMQDWDYFLSMSAIKKMQGMYQGTLVAQGAFSIYATEKVREANGWPNSIGEDIVLTWKLLNKGYVVYYEPLAIAFTDVPEHLTHFIKQRRRWARGMIEGLKISMPWKFPNLYYKFLTFIDLIIIYMDFSYTFFFIPGLVLMLFGNYMIVGKYYLLVLPLTLITFSIIYFSQRRRVFDILGLKVRHNFFGFILFILTYQFIMSPVSMLGYMQEIFQTKRIWK